MDLSTLQPTTDIHLKGNPKAAEGSVGVPVIYRYRFTGKGEFFTTDLPAAVTGSRFTGKSVNFQRGK
jgi:hypothetical protein